ncbi:isoprenoid synthase domain-containing protein [Aspergillus multicolor]|uniref:terpene synthase family protein n=1 Tax=Aspergillus multicolor TaxID=41759 RepID=UPI003CCCDD01
MAIETTHNHDVLWSSLEGQDMQIPNLIALLPEGEEKMKLHPEYKKCRDEVLNPWIRRWTNNDTTCQALQKGEFGLFAAMICADASYDKLCTVAKFFAWYYLWDDLFDHDTLRHETAHGMSDNRRVSITYIAHQLLPENKDNAEAPDLDSYPEQLVKALRAWDEIGVHIRQDCSEGTRKVLCDAMTEYMDSVGAVNALFADGKKPTVQEFVAGLDITSSDVAGDQMKALWRDTSYFVHIKSSYADGQIENLIPVLVLNKDVPIKDAVDEAYELANNHITSLEASASALERDDISQPVSRAFAKGCKDLVAALVHWNYEGGRYLNDRKLDDEGVFHFQIEKCREK